VGPRLFVPVLSVLLLLRLLLLIPLGPPRLNPRQ
jgi:hypothetical protein